MTRRDDRSAGCGRCADERLSEQAARCALRLSGGVAVVWDPAGGPLRLLGGDERLAAALALDAAPDPGAWLARVASADAAAVRRGLAGEPCPPAGVELTWRGARGGGGRRLRFRWSPAGPRRVIWIEELGRRSAPPGGIDPLTGLPDRAALLDAIREQLRRPTDAEVALIAIDLDRFGAVNHAFGPGVGDRVLAAVAERLRRAVRRDDLLARIDGAAFALLVRTSPSPLDVERLARRLEAKLAGCFAVGGREIWIRASAGVVRTSRRRHAGADQVLRDACVAAACARALGGGSARVFEPAMQRAAVDAVRLDGELRRAVARSEFVVHYQPIVELARGSVAGVEALVRWRHPERGLLAPGAFLPAAETSDLIRAIGDLVLERALTDAARWERTEGLSPPPVSVNVSARQLAHPEFVDGVARRVAEAGIDPARLRLEVTETVLMERSDAVVPALAALRASGMRIVLDDFGTGYSSLAYLHDLPIDGLKIDRTFVAASDRDARSGAILNALIELGRELGLDVVVEGVETPEQLARLVAAGAARAQGFLFARPAEASAVETWLAAGARPWREWARCAVPEVAS